MSDGKKYDSGKIQPALVLESMSRAIMAVCEVATHGAEKYSADNWLKVSDGLSRYKNAKHRHMLQGAVEHRDSESGLLHAAHEAWNALAVLELMLRAKPGIDEQVLDGWDKQAVDAAAFNAWDAGEQHIDAIGQNGGEHYESYGWIVNVGEKPDVDKNQLVDVVFVNGDRYDGVRVNRLFWSLPGENPTNIARWRLHKPEYLELPEDAVIPDWCHWIGVDPDAEARGFGEKPFFDFDGEIFDTESDYDNGEPLFWVSHEPCLPALYQRTDDGWLRVAE